MDHLLPLPDELLAQLEAYCIPFREEFYECRVDGRERHDPIPDPSVRLTLNAATMVSNSGVCRQWSRVEKFLYQMNHLRKPETMALRSDNPGVLMHDPMVLRPRAMGKSLSTDAIVKALATVAATVCGPIPRVNDDHEFVVGDTKIKLSRPTLGDLSSFSSIWGRHFGAGENRFRTWDEGHHWPAREVYNPPWNPNTTDYPLPRGGKRIPKHGEKECRPSSKLLALIARSQ